MPLIILLALVYSVSRYTDLTGWGMTQSSPWWTAITAQLLHLNLLHLLSNSVLIAMYSRWYTRWLNPYISIPLTALVSIISITLSAQQMPTCGASCIVCAMMGLIVATQERKASLKNALMISCCIILTALLPSSVNWQAHAYAFSAAAVVTSLLGNKIYAAR